MEESRTDIKAKISFSVESLLSSNKPLVGKIEEDVDDHLDHRLDTSSEHLDEDDENITVDDEDTDGRESLSPNSSHTVLVPQPLHPSMPRLLSPTHHPQWPFTWVGPAGLMRSSSPQSKLKSGLHAP